MFSEAGWRQKPFHWFSIFAATHFNSRVLRKSEFRSTIFGVFEFVVFTTTPSPLKLRLKKCREYPCFLPIALHRIFISKMAAPRFCSAFAE
jgi:hypothetical protein